MHLKIWFCKVHCDNIRVNLLTAVVTGNMISTKRVKFRAFVEALERWCTCEKCEQAWEGMEREDLLQGGLLADRSAENLKLRKYTSYLFLQKYRVIFPP